MQTLSFIQRLKLNSLSLCLAVLFLLTACSSASRSSVENTLQGWLSEDIGSVAIAGKASSKDESVMIEASGEGIGADADSFHFVYQSFKGNASFIAEVSRLSSATNKAQAALMMRDSLDANAKSTAIAFTASEGNWFSWRSQKASEAEVMAGNKSSEAKWLKLSREGSVFSAQESLDGVTWTDVFSQEISMQEEILVGLAVASQSNTEVTQSVFESVSLEAIEPNVEPDPEPKKTFPKVELSEMAVILDGESIVDKSYDFKLDNPKKDP